MALTPFILPYTVGTSKIVIIPHLREMFVKTNNY
jgi:hypothetical protein